MTGSADSLFESCDPVLKAVDTLFSPLTSDGHVSDALHGAVDGYQFRRDPHLSLDESTPQLFTVGFEPLETLVHTDETRATADRLGLSLSEYVITYVNGVLEARK